MSDWVEPGDALAPAATVGEQLVDELGEAFDLDELLAAAETAGAQFAAELALADDPDAILRTTNESDPE